MNESNVDRFYIRIKNEYITIKNNLDLNPREKEIAYLDIIRKLANRYSFKYRGVIKLNNDVPQYVVEMLNDIEIEKNKVKQ